MKEFLRLAAGAHTASVQEIAHEMQKKVKAEAEKFATSAAVTYRSLLRKVRKNRLPKLYERPRRCKSLQPAMRVRLSDPSDLSQEELFPINPNGTMILGSVLPKKNGSIEKQS